MGADLLSFFLGCKCRGRDIILGMDVTGAVPPLFYSGNCGDRLNLNTIRAAFLPYCVGGAAEDRV